MAAFIDRVGQRFGRLVVISRDLNASPGNSKWMCRCDCGREKSVLGMSLACGDTKSCGCLAVEGRRARKLTHGQSGRRDGVARSLAYGTWTNMKARCNNPQNPAYPDYGGRGIRVHPAWLDSFEQFVADVGDAPSRQHSLDRIDNEGNYEPGNCRWATRREQGRNKRNNVVIELDGVTRTVPEWSELLGLSGNVIRQRLKRGLPAVEALKV